MNVGRPDGPTGWRSPHLAKKKKKKICRCPPSLRFCLPICLCLSSPSVFLSCLITFPLLDNSGRSPPGGMLGFSPGILPGLTHAHTHTYTHTHTHTHTQALSYIFCLSAYLRKAIITHWGKLYVERLRIYFILFFPVPR